MSKKELQATARSLGLEFTSRTTVVQLRQLIADAEAPAPAATPDPNKRCPVCRRVFDHVHG